MGLTVIRTTEVYDYCLQLCDILDERFSKEFPTLNMTIEVEEAENLREASIRNKLSIYPHVTKILNCRGRGLCTACTVQVL